MALRYWIGGGSSSNWNATSPSNWAATSGGTITVTPPGASDDVIFDGNGNSDSVISANVTVRSLTVDPAYTATITHNAILTISGVGINISNNYTIAGSSGIVINAAASVNFNNRTWPNNLTFGGGGTKTLTGNLTVGGLFTTSGTAFIISATSAQTITILNGMTISSSTKTDAKVVLAGGLIQSSQGFDANVDIAGDVTFSTFSWVSGSDVRTLKYISGNVTFTGTLFITTSSNLAFPANIDLGPNCVPLNVDFNGTVVLNLVSELKVSSNFNIAVNATFLGNAGFNVATFRTKTIQNGENPNTSVVSLKADPNIVYKTKFLQCVSNDPGYVIVRSSTPGTRAKFIVTETSTVGTEMRVNLSFIDIDASGGFPIFTFANPYDVWLSLGDSPNNNNVFFYRDVKAVGKPIFNS